MSGIESVSTAWDPRDLDARHEFFAPSLLLTGRGVSGDVGARLGGAARTVLVTDGAVRGAAVLEPLLEGLRAAGHQVTLAEHAGAEPTAESVDAVASAAREAGAEVVIGAGGGSVMDAAKFTAVMVRNGGTSRDFIGEVAPSNGVAPLVLIPTTCGTGSEATRYAVVTIDGHKRASSCPRYVPGIAVIDPDLVASLPAPVVAASGMDALAHAVEVTMSTLRSPMVTQHARDAIGLLLDHLEPAVQGDSDARAACLWASHIAGQALNAGVVLGHSLAYCLAHASPMAHGVSCALVLPYCLAYNQAMDPDVGKELTRLLTRGAGDTLLDAAVVVRQLAARLGLPTTLSDVGITEDLDAGIAATCVGEYLRPGNPVPMEADRVSDLLKTMRTGDLPAAFAIP